MIRKRTRVILSPALLALLLIANPTLAEERILADDGREVLLKDDGSWEYVSDDRFGTTASGERVRLKADGGWEIVTDVQAVAPAGGIVLTDTGPAHWALADVTIETARSERGGSKKGIVKKTQTLFTLEARLRNEAETAVPIALDAGSVSVTDSGGRAYPVLGVDPDLFNLDGERARTVVVRVDGAPHWFTTKFFELKIAAGAVGNVDDIRLKRALSNVRKRDVEDLSR